MNKECNFYKGNHSDLIRLNSSIANNIKNRTIFMPFFISKYLFKTLPYVTYFEKTILVMKRKVHCRKETM